jgi:hypothetical protein
MKVFKEIEEEICVTLDDFMDKYEVDDVLDYIQDSTVQSYGADLKSITVKRFKNHIKKWVMAKFDLIERPND